LRVEKRRCEGQDRGHIITLQLGGRTWESYWSSPPDNCDHVDVSYLKNRYPIITTEKRAAEFKRQFKNLWIEITPYQLDLMKHALGLDYHEKPYRNYFCTQETDKAWNELTEKGLAVKGTKKPDNKYIYFWCSKQGVEYVTGKRISEEAYKKM
jgi:hypothetical protein